MAWWIYSALFLVQSYSFHGVVSRTVHTHNTSRIDNQNLFSHRMTNNVRYKVRGQNFRWSEGCVFLQCGLYLDHMLEAFCKAAALHFNSMPRPMMSSVPVDLITTLLFTFTELWTWFPKCLCSSTFLEILLFSRIWCCCFLHIGTDENNSFNKFVKLRSFWPAGIFWDILQSSPSQTLDFLLEN